MDMGFISMPGYGADNVRDNKPKHTVEKEQKKYHDDHDNDELKKENPGSQVSNSLMDQRRRCYQLKPWVRPLGPPNCRFTMLKRRNLLHCLQIRLSLI